MYREEKKTRKIMKRTSTLFFKITFTTRQYRRNSLLNSIWLFKTDKNNKTVTYPRGNFHSQFKDTEKRFLFILKQKNKTHTHIIYTYMYIEKQSFLNKQEKGMFGLIKFLFKNSSIISENFINFY